MARALIVGCGCRGRELGAALCAEGWQVRGTSRDPAAAVAIEAAGIEFAQADPDRAITLVEALDGVAVIFWLLGSARGPQEALAAIHGPRLERLLEEIVDTPVRGFVLERAGSVPEPILAGAEATLRAAAERWRIPVEAVGADPGDPERWRRGMLAATKRLVGGY